MPSFTCEVCHSSFEVPQAALDKYPGWQPKYCRLHSPKKRTGARRGGQAGSAGQVGGGGRGGSGGRGGGTDRGRTLREENLTLAEVLAKYPEPPGAASGVFTDGSAAPNPGPGGWGVVWVEDGRIVRQAHGHDPDTTNNRMELRALIEAFSMLPVDAEVEVLTDSELCVNTITRWAPAWERAGWKRKAGPIKNLEMVRKLLALYRAHPGCKLRWTAAHTGNRWNEYADSLATAWMRPTL